MLCLVTKILELVDVIMACVEQIRVINPHMMKGVDIKNIITVKSICINNAVRDDLILHDTH